MILMREAGMEVVETTLSVEDFNQADEIFSTGNYSKVMAVNKFNERELQPGPVAAKAKKMNWDWAHS
jgi:branched-chain amino acid aminotransferase